MTARKYNPAALPVMPDLNYEKALWASGLTAVAGIDEAGRGALAGPVTAGVVIFPPDPGLLEKLFGVRDSKQMKPAEREHWATLLPELVQACAVGFASNQEIDEIGIVPATRLAIQRAIQALPLSPQHLLLDYIDLPESPLPQTSLVKGDMHVLSIAAASIMAKTARDRYLCDLDKQFPGYGLAAHKGYGTVAHRRAMVSLGLSPIHRRSFRLKGNGEDDDKK